MNDLSKVSALVLAVAMLLCSAARAESLAVGDRAEVTKKTKLWPATKGDKATPVKPGAIVVIKQLKGKTALASLEQGKATGWIKLKYLRSAAKAAATETAASKCESGSHQCKGAIVQRCVQGKWVDWDNCSVQNWTCAVIEGKAQCHVPGQTPPAAASPEPAPAPAPAPTPKPTPAPEPDTATKQRAQQAKAEGDRLRKAKKYSEAAREYRKALLAWPGFAEAHNGLGQVLYKLKDLPGAVKSYSKAVQLKPDYATARFNLAFTLRKAGKFSAAETSYRRYIELKPGDPDGHYGLAAAFEEQGKAKEAAGAYRKYAELEKDPRSRKWVDEALAKAAKLEQSAAAPPPPPPPPPAPEVDEATKVQARQHKDEGDRLRKAKQYSEAAEAYRKAIALWPTFAEANNALGQALYKLKDLDGAETAYLAAVKARPEYAKAHYNLGFTRRKLGKFADAEASYRRYTELEPADPDGYYGLAAALEKQGKAGEAARFYRRYGALETRPSEKKWVDEALAKAAELERTAGAEAPPWVGEDRAQLVTGVKLKGKVVMLKQGVVLLATSEAGETLILSGAVKGEGIVTLHLEQISTITCRNETLQTQIEHAMQASMAAAAETSELDELDGLGQPAGAGPAAAGAPKTEGDELDGLQATEGQAAAGVPAEQGGQVVSLLDGTTIRGVIVRFEGQSVLIATTPAGETLIMRGQTSGPGVRAVNIEDVTDVDWGVRDDELQARMDQAMEEYASDDSLYSKFSIFAEFETQVTVEDDDGSGGLKMKFGPRLIQKREREHDGYYIEGQLEFEFDKPTSMEWDDVDKAEDLLTFGIAGASEGDFGGDSSSQTQSLITSYLPDYARYGHKIYLGGSHAFIFGELQLAYDFKTAHGAGEGPDLGALVGAGYGRVLSIAEATRALTIQKALMDAGTIERKFTRFVQRQIEAIFEQVDSPQQQTKAIIELLQKRGYFKGQPGYEESMLVLQVIEDSFARRLEGIEVKAGFLNDIGDQRHKDWVNYNGTLALFMEYYKPVSDKTQLTEQVVFLQIVHPEPRVTVISNNLSVDFKASEALLLTFYDTAALINVPDILTAINNIVGLRLNYYVAEHVSVVVDAQVLESYEAESETNYFDAKLSAKLEFIF